MVSPYSKIIRHISRHPLKFIAGLLVIIYTVCITTIMISENVGFLRAMLILMPSVFGELGTVEANPTDIASILSLGIYVCFLGLIFGKISQVLVDLSVKGGGSHEKSKS